VDESRAVNTLMSEDGEKRPRDRKTRRKVTLRGGESVSSCSCLEEKSTGRKNYVCQEQVVTHKARNTKTLVQTSAGRVSALTPNASNAVKTTRTVVHP
jgi:hypothetical protein